MNILLIAVAAFSSLLITSLAFAQTTLRSKYLLHYAWPPGQYTLKVEDATTGVPDNADVKFGENGGHTIVLSVTADAPTPTSQTLHVAYQSIASRQVIDATHTLVHSSDPVPKGAIIEAAWRDMCGIPVDIHLTPDHVAPRITGMDKLWSAISNDPDANILLKDEQREHGEAFLRVLFVQSMPELPPAPVAVGEAWKYPRDEQKAVNGAVTMSDKTATLRAIDESHGQRIADVVLTANFTVTPTNANAAIDKTVHAEARLDVDSGQPIETTLDTVTTWLFPDMPALAIKTKWVASFKRNARAAPVR